MDERSSIPVMAILVTTAIAALLSLINVGSSVAFNDVVSLSINGLYTSYLIGNSLLLWRRVAGHVGIPSESTHSEQGSRQFQWGPWRLPEPIGTINNAFGCGFLVVILIFSCFPVGKNPTPSTMNYVIVMEGGVVILAIFYYVVWGRETYKGPVVEIEA